MLVVIREKCRAREGRVKPLRFPPDCISMRWEYI